MSLIFMDESGDLGFEFRKRGTSKHFLITFLFCTKKRPIEKCIRRVHAMLRKKEQRVNVLHANRERPVTRRRVLECLAQRELGVMAVILNKQKVYTRLQDEKQVLYNYVTNILIDRILSRNILPDAHGIRIIASRRETNRFLNENFKSYLESKTYSTHRVRIQVQIRTPSEEKGLQAVDFISWSIFRKLELGDPAYYELIKDRIVEENRLFP